MENGFYLIRNDPIPYWFSIPELIFFLIVEIIAFDFFIEDIINPNRYSGKN